ITTIDSISEEDISTLKKHLVNMFPGLDINYLQKQKTRKNKPFVDWLQAHCRERTYTFQIRRCNDITCCLPPSTDPEMMKWLPDPILDHTNEHYKPFSEVYGTDTTDLQRPSLLMKENKGTKRPKIKIQSTGKDEIKSLYNDQSLEADSSIYTVQNSHSTVLCTECRKPRVIYYIKSQLTGRHLTQLALLLSEFDYTCGSP